MRGNPRRGGGPDYRATYPEPGGATIRFASAATASDPDTEGERKTVAKALLEELDGSGNALRRPTLLSVALTQEGLQEDFAMRWIVFWPVRF